MRGRRQHRVLGDFTQAVVKLRRRFDAYIKTYAALARDPEVKAAMEQLNPEGSKPQYVLGPTPSRRKLLEGLESLVLADSVPVHREAGGLWVAAVTFNDKVTHDLEIDSGASTVVLPWNVAKEVGLTPPADAPREKRSSPTARRSRRRSCLPTASASAASPSKTSSAA